MFLKSAARRVRRQDGDGGKIKWKLSEVNIGGVSKRTERIDRQVRDGDKGCG